LASRAVILGTARTPFGRLGGALSTLSATTLAAAAIRGVLERSHIAPEVIEHVILGQVLQAGAGQAPVRQALLKAGLATTVTGETVNKVCASGMLALAMAAQSIRQGSLSVGIAGGMESMSNAPHLLRKMRSGIKYGDGVIEDSVLHDGLLDVYLDITMASASARVAGEIGPSREMQDAFAYQSHRRAASAIERNALHDEIIPLQIPERGTDKLVVEHVPVPAKPNSLLSYSAPAELSVDYAKISPFIEGTVPSKFVEHDESVRLDVSLAAMSSLKALDRGGSITAGNAPGLNDGAAVLVVADEDWARANNITPLAEIVAHATVAWEPAFLALTPALAIEKLLKQQNLTLADISVWEINEAFAAVALGSANHLGLAADVINRQGGAIAIGHPLGASGARIVASVVHQLRRNGGGLGIAAICSGGGQGDAMLIRVEAE
jgi:acetyl-CoA C-acetyltransferase